jgi:hypothetical protein
MTKLMGDDMSIGDYMDLVMKKSMREALSEQSLDAVYRRLYFTNMVQRATNWEESDLDLDKDNRHRMSKEIADELIDMKGNGAYIYCLEKLANDTKAPRLWRAVLAYLDEHELNRKPKPEGEEK